MEQTQRDFYGVRGLETGLSPLTRVCCKTAVLLPLSENFVGNFVEKWAVPTKFNDKVCDKVTEKTTFATAFS